MAASLRMQVWRVSGGPLITDAMAEGATLRLWGAHDAHRLAVAIATGIYSGEEARRELATTLAWHAERAGIRSVSCRALAADMLADESDVRETATQNIKRLVAPMIAIRKPSGAVFAEAHGFNGKSGFPLTEEEVTDVVKREMYFALPPAPGGARHAR